jgi:hypothetical protein
VLNTAKHSPIRPIEISTEHGIRKRIKDKPMTAQTHRREFLQASLTEKASHWFDQ